MPTNWPETDWTDVVGTFFESETWQQLSEFVAAERKTETVFPSANSVFNAFRLTPYASTRVVILGQDPYHGAGQAHGLSFSVVDGVKVPPSLRNIYKELESDLGIEPAVTGNLEPWAKQGVLLLNTVLTVREGAAASHRKKGWEQFTDAVITSLNQHPQQVIFVLWGKPAEAKEKLIDQRHAVIKSPHPSPLSARRGFFGSQPFSRINSLLEQSGGHPIDWRLSTADAGA